MKLIILAGGSGTRLWPVSRKNSPKQVKPIIGKDTLLQKTFSRLRAGFPVNDIYVATNKDQLPLIKKQLRRLPAANYIIEPAKRDTAAAIGLALIKIYKEDSQAVIMNINSDHHIRNEKAYLKIIKLASRIIKERPAVGVLLGVNPTYPETGYGYIKMGREAAEIGGVKIFHIAEFKEKPNLARAKKYIEQWAYLWNMGCFAWRADTLLALYKEHLPGMYRILMRIHKALGSEEEEQVIAREFKKIRPISMDYGIVEKARKLVVIPADFGWADVGHWRTVKNVLSKKVGDNIIMGNVVEIDSRGNLVYSYSGKLIALAGVSNMVIIETKDAILVCPHERAQDVKKIVDKLKESGQDKYL